MGIRIVVIVFMPLEGKKYDYNACYARNISILRGELSDYETFYPQGE